VSSVGKYVERFESEFALKIGAQYAVACTNGSAALHAALRIAGISQGDEVIVPTITFIAPVNAISYVGAEPVFMDCDPFYNIDIKKTVDFIQKETYFRQGHTVNKTSGKKISALIPVHVFGNAVDLESLIDLCTSRNIKIIEDATESLGTYYIQGTFKGRYTGTIGEVGCCSFNGNKIITTGGGGMLVTHKKEIAEKAKYLTTQAKDDPIRYIHDEIGYNYRLSNIQAAMGVAQLEQLGDFLKTKKRNYEYYRESIEEISGLSLAEVPDYAENNHWMYSLQITQEKFGRNRDQLMGYLAEHGIQTRPVWYANHLQKPYKQCQNYRVERANDLLDRTLSIPCSVSLEQKNIDYIIRVLKEAGRK